VQHAHSNNGPVMKEQEQEIGGVKACHWQVPLCQDLLGQLDEDPGQESRVQGIGEKVQKLVAEAERACQGTIATM